MKYTHTKTVARQASLARGVAIGLFLALATALPGTGRAQTMSSSSSPFSQLSPSSQTSAKTASGGQPCNGRIAPAGLKAGSKGSNSQDNLVISKSCYIDTAGDYVYGNVNIVGNGTLEFREPVTAGKVNFWASNIIIENGGTLKAGTERRPSAAGARC